MKAALSGRMQLLLNSNQGAPAQDLAQVGRFVGYAVAHE